MCRFNLILVKDEITEELLKKAEYQKAYDDLDGYKAYLKGYCNCGSLVGSLNDKKGMEYYEAISARKKEKLEQLYQIRELMHQPGYKEMKDTFLRKREELSEELHAFFEQIGKFEAEETDIIYKKYSGDILHEQMEKLYSEVTARISALDEQPAYRQKHEIYAKFIEENKIMNDSTIYYLTEEEEEKSGISSVKLTDLLDIDIEQISGEEDRIEYGWESMVIDEVIDRTEKDTSKNNQEEYNSYFELFKELLMHVQSFRFSTIWSEPNELKKIKTTSLTSLKIDDLAFLGFDEMVCITK